MKTDIPLDPQKPIYQNFCASQLQCDSVPTYTDAGEQLNKNSNKSRGVQSELGKKSIPERFPVPHHR